MTKEEGLRAFHSLLGSDVEEEEEEGKEGNAVWEVARDAVLDEARSQRKKMTAKDRARGVPTVERVEEVGKVWVEERKEQRKQMVEVVELLSDSEAEDYAALRRDEEVFEYISLSGEEDEDDDADVPRMYDLHSEGAFVDLT